MTSSQKTNANALMNKTSAERETCHAACNKPCSWTEGDKQHHHHQQQQEYSSSSSPQNALFRATLFCSGQCRIFSLFFPYFSIPGCIPPVPSALLFFLLSFSLPFFITSIVSSSNSNSIISLIITFIELSLCSFMFSDWMK